MDDAIAARVGQADEKGWKAYIKETDAAVRSLVLPTVSDAAPVVRKDEQAILGFFSQMQKLKGKHQV